MKNKNTELVWDRTSNVEFAKKKKKNEDVGWDRTTYLVIVERNTNGP
jgi:hypothetical protein